MTNADNPAIASPRGPIARSGRARAVSRGLLVVAGALAVEPGPALSQATSALRAAYPGSPAPSYSTTARLLPYPHPVSLALGQGWDSARASPKQALCVAFAEQRASHQIVRSEMTEAVDNEALTVTLGYSSSASAGLAGDLFSAKAEASVNLSGYVKSTAKHRSIVATASVLNGGVFAAPTEVTVTARNEKIRTYSKGNAVDLREDVLGLLDHDGHFERRCGDGYVSAILSGGQIHAVFSFSESTYEDQVTLASAIKASAGFLGLSASSSATLNAQITKALETGRLRISLFANGGSGLSLPTTADALRTTFSGFPAQVAEHARPLYVLVRPYSELPSWPSKTLSSPPRTCRQSLERFLARLAYLHRTIDDILLEGQRDMKAFPETAYTTSALLGDLRAEPLLVLQDHILELSNAASRELEKRESDSASQECEDLSIDALTDFPLRVLLPMPVNAVPSDVLVRLKDQGISRAARADAYARFLFQYWVDGPSRARCATLGECLPNATLKRYRSVLLQSFGTMKDAPAYRAFLNEWCGFPGRQATGGTLPLLAAAVGIEPAPDDAGCDSFKDVFRKYPSAFPSACDGKEALQ